MRLNATAQDIKSVARYSTPEKRELVNNTRTSHLSDDMVAENMRLLERCRSYYQGLSDFRERRLRAFNYYRGRQWQDGIEDDDGNIITEEQYILNRGKIPFVQNVIRQLLRNIIGQMESNPTSSIVDSRTPEDASLSEMLTNTLQSIQQVNETEIIDPRTFEEFLISGMMISKSTYSYIPDKGREDVFTKNVNPNFFGFNTDIKDIRGTDLRLLFELVDAPLEDILATFAQNDADIEKIKSWYPIPNDSNPGNSMPFDGSQEQNVDFYIPSDINLARMIVVWEKVTDWRLRVHDYMTAEFTVAPLNMVKAIKAENAQRIKLGLDNGVPEDKIKLIQYKKKLDSFWVVKYLTPYGQSLFQSETPYAHKSHPYTLTAYPMINGEVWGLVEDIIDQQRNINRNFALLDFIMGSAAKGVLMVAEEAIPDDMDLQDFADEWTKYNGVIKFKAKAGVPLPKQVSANITNIGAQEMLAIQLNMIQEIAGVNGAIQGKEAKAGTPNSLYVNQAANSSTNVKDLMNNYNWHMNKRNEKMLKLAIQYYREKRYVASSGIQYDKEAAYYDPDRVKNFDFNLKISEGNDTPVFRQAISDNLFQMLQANMIDLQMFLENSGMPYAEKLLASLKSREEQAQKQQQGQPPQQQVAGQPQQPVPQPQAQQAPAMSPEVNKLYERLKKQ